MSAKMTWPMVMIPPPPMPWIDRPTKKTGKFLAMGAQRMVPRVKRKTDETSISLRPKMSDRAAMKGWHTAHDRRYDVPAQKASFAVPLRSTANAYARQVGQLELCTPENVPELALTGSTDTKIVASRATISETMASVIITAYSFFPGFHWSSGMGPFSKRLPCIRIRFVVCSTSTFSECGIVGMVVDWAGLGPLPGG